MLPKHVAKVNRLIQNFNFLSIHNIQLIYMGILDLVFDTSNANVGSSLPTPFSDHFVPFFQI